MRYQAQSDGLGRQNDVTPFACWQVLDHRLNRSCKKPSQSGNPSTMFTGAKPWPLQSKP
jgi:hypothetical protein